MKPITLFRNKDCAFCANMAKVHARFDWLNRLECSADEAPSGPLKMGEIEVVDHRTGERLKGVKAVRKVAKQIPAYWPILPFLYLPPVAKRVDATTSGCDDGHCELPGVNPL